VISASPKAFADLVEQGFIVCFPATEHAPFDLVAYRHGRFHRVQVKYRAFDRGAVTVQLTSGWTDRHGVHKRPIDRDAIDVICIYCPESNECYYVRPPTAGTEVRLRVVPARNNQRRGIASAAHFRRMPGELTTVPPAADATQPALFDQAPVPQPPSAEPSTTALPSDVVP
jgi:hypothetical protein